ncbi:MAG: tripartite tricarboxylate transporter substrate binding protein [Peptococcaceae bacterium]|jgi:tripartite-type tricarboxylate transporter receptor subunit TctC|nr:tripartite tricarboxylate transporter substrate binding protein [Peptococcaceae bacterium]
MFKSGKLIIIPALLLILGLVGGCGSSAPAPSAPPAQSSPPASEATVGEPQGSEPVAAVSNFPTKEITLICPWNAGASADLQCRALAQAASKYLPQPVVVLNQEGAGGILATTQMVTTAADGYTVALGVIGLFTAQPVLNPDLGYKQEDFDFLISTASAPCAIMVNATSPYQTVADLVKDATENNKTLTFGSPGANSTPHLAGEQFFKLTGVKGQHVPFTGGSPTMTALMGDQIDAASLVISDAIPQINAGTLRALAVASEERVPSLPDIPTMKEAGYDYVFKPSWYLFAPAGLPADVKAILTDAFTKGVEDPDFKKAMDDLNIAVEYKNEADTLASFASQKAVIQELVDSGLGS